jgi:hypothetical protein
LLLALVACSVHAQMIPLGSVGPGAPPSPPALVCVSTLACSSTMNVAAGNLIVAGVRVATGTTASSVCDGVGGSCTGSDTFLPLSACTGGAANDWQWFYAANTASNSTATVKVTWAASGTFSTLWAAQFSGLSTSSPLDVGPACNNGVAGTATTATFTTAFAAEVLVTGFSFASLSASCTPGSGYTLASAVPDGDSCTQYQVVSAIQTGVTGQITTGGLTFQGGQITFHQ